MTTDEYQPVADFYAGKSVLVTGFTGFLGKVLVEKLLYSCPDIAAVYVLIRERNNLSVDQRLRKILEMQAFSRLKEERPGAIAKIVPVTGDISLTGLGLRPEEEHKLISQVSVVFHLAATIKFNEPLKFAMSVNVEGTRRILELSKRMKKAEMFVYISTAFSNTDKEVVEEVIYPLSTTAEEVRQTLKNLDDNQLEKQENSLLCGRPNTYTFTKALAENLVAKEHGSLPAIVIRPSVVTAGISEPLPGWVDNWYGATTLVVTTAKGVTNALLGENGFYIDLIPVDYVANLCIIAPAKSDRKKDVAVYNCTTSDANPITLRKLVTTIRQESVKQKFNDMPLFPAFLITPHKWLLFMITCLIEIIPAYLSDLIFRFKGLKPRCVQVQSRGRMMREVLNYFTSRTWLMRDKESRALVASLSHTDRRHFMCDPSAILWSDYISIYIRGIRKYLLKEQI